MNYVPEKLRISNHIIIAIDISIKSIVYNYAYYVLQSIKQIALSPPTITQSMFEIFITSYGTAQHQERKLLHRQQ